METDNWDIERESVEAALNSLGDKGFLEYSNNAKGRRFWAVRVYKLRTGNEVGYVVLNKKEHCRSCVKLQDAIDLCTLAVIDYRGDLPQSCTAATRSFMANWKNDMRWVLFNKGESQEEEVVTRIIEKSDLHAGVPALGRSFLLSNNMSGQEFSFYMYYRRWNSGNSMFVPVFLFANIDVRYKGEFFFTTVYDLLRQAVHGKAAVGIHSIQNPRLLHSQIIKGVHVWDCKEEPTTTLEFGAITLHMNGAPEYTWRNPVTSEG